MSSAAGKGRSNALLVTAAAATTVVVAGVLVKHLVEEKARQRKAAKGKPQNVVWDKPLAELPTEKVVLVVDGANVLGEGTAWYSDVNELWWVDIEGKKVMKLHLPDGPDGKVVADGWDVPKRLGSMALREPGGKNPECPLLVAFEDGFSFYDFRTGKRASAVDPPGAADEYEQLPHSRTNDGRCDREGRFYCGGMGEINHGKGHELWNPHCGVYRVEKGKGIRRVLPTEVFSCYNTTCFSPDGRIMYNCDSSRGIVWAFECDPETGDLSNKRMFLDMNGDPSGGSPDGATIDTEGCMWLAVWGPGEVRRYSPEGKLLRTLEVPGAKQVTCTAIGGPDLDILFISSASDGLTDEQRVQQPNAGALFAVRLEGVKGISEPRYRG